MGIQKTRVGEKGAFLVCFRVLTSIHDKMRTTHDISVRFFGIDWQHMFRISYNLGELVTEMAELARERDEHFQVWRSSYTKIDRLIIKSTLFSLWFFSD